MTGRDRHAEHDCPRCRDYLAAQRRRNSSPATYPTHPVPKRGSAGRSDAERRQWARLMEAPTYKTRSRDAEGADQ